MEIGLQTPPIRSRTGPKKFLPWFVFLVISYRSSHQSFQLDNPMKSSSVTDRQTDKGQSADNTVFLKIR